MKGKMILLVEDNADDELLMLRSLRKHNLVNEIVVARDGAEALDFLLARGAYMDRDPLVLPQLILLDLNLPKLDGLEVLRRLREHDRLKLIPVVVLTTSDEEGDMLRSYELHANSYVRKPVDFVQFAEAVRQIGLYWLVLNELPDNQ